MKVIWWYLLIFPGRLVLAIFSMGGNTPASSSKHNTMVLCSVAHSCTKLWIREELPGSWSIYIIYSSKKESIVTAIPHGMSEFCEIFVSWQKPICNLVKWKQFMNKKRCPGPTLEDASCLTLHTLSSNSNGSWRWVSATHMGDRSQPFWPFKAWMGNRSLLPAALQKNKTAKIYPSVSAISPYLDFWVK